MDGPPRTRVETDAGVSYNNRASVEVHKGTGGSRPETLGMGRFSPCIANLVGSGIPTSAQPVF